MLIFGSMYYALILVSWLRTIYNILYLLQFLGLLSDKSERISSETNDLEVASESSETKEAISPKTSGEDKPLIRSETITSEPALDEGMLLTYERKVTVLFELVSACVAGDSGGGTKTSREHGYDARHRVALRLLSKWLNIKWIKMVCLLSHHCM